MKKRLVVVFALVIVLIAGAITWFVAKKSSEVKTYKNLVTVDTTKIDNPSFSFRFDATYRWKSREEKWRHLPELKSHINTVCIVSGQTEEFTVPGDKSIEFVLNYELNGKKEKQIIPINATKPMPFKLALNFDKQESLHTSISYDE